MPGADIQLPSDFPERLAASISNWKRKLLDLSRRNRALNFRATKVSTVAIVDEQPAEVFRHLYLDEATMRFRPAEGEDAGESEAGEDLVVQVEVNGEPLDFDSESEESLEYVPYDRIALDDRHRDDWLQTKLMPEALDHSLRRIDEQARSSMEEQGVNTLFLALGMLQYRESRDSEIWWRAPLVFLPVQLSRRSARSGYSVAAGDEDALVNPALAEYLRGSFGISLPEFPDSESMSDDYDLQVFFKSAADAVASQSGWAIQTDIFLGLFSFQKLVLFKDLEKNVDAIGNHRLIQQLLARVGSSIHGLPPEIRELPLDSDFTPENTFQVVDADSSQMRAAAAVVKGHDIVIEGPPGTGKSQTITNLVAQALAEDKSVLFVAEKMAALDVVHRRLAEAGLAEFCLELHSSKANKRAVMKDISTALDASLIPLTTDATPARRLPQVRAALAKYAKAVHEPFAALGKSPYHVAGELGHLLQAPRLKLTLDPSTVTADALADAQRALADLEAHARNVGNPSEHPWRDTGKTLYTEDDLQAIRTLAAAVETTAVDLATRADRAAQMFGVPLASTLSQMEGLAEFADLLGSSPGVEPDILQSDAWSQPPADAVQLLNLGRKMAALRARLGPKFKDDAFDVEHADDIAYVEQKSSGILSFLAFLDAQYRAIKRRWQGYVQAGYAPPILDQASDLKQVDEMNRLRRALEAETEQGTRLFGRLWLGPASDWTRLDGYLQYVVRYRAVAISRGLSGAAAAVAQNPAPDVGVLRELVEKVQAHRAQLRELRTAVAWPDDYLDSAPVTAIGARAARLIATIGSAPAWAAFEGSRQRAAATVAHDAVTAALDGSIPFDQLTSAFLRSFYMQWMSAAVQAREPLRGFDTLAHEALVNEFRQVDAQVLLHNRAALTSMLRERVQQRLREPQAAASLPRLRREMAKQRRLSPLRRMLHESEGAIRAIKPCFLMSPLTAAQYLAGGSPSFDVVIFDEASQLPTEDAVGAIIRGRQLVVVGDPKQLPPTDFFSVSSGFVSAPLGDDGTPLYEDSESVLEEFMGAAVPMSRLKWHYRSAHESLITFSNVSFYDADLHTFPSVLTDTDATGLLFSFIDDGVYEGKGVNMTEARRIADDVVGFARRHLTRKAAGERSLSLGVGTLNLRQQLAILDELEVRRRDDPSIEPFFDRSLDEPFFVKNLENIQGDERDVIFLSVTYGKASDGRLRYNFGPLNRENGWRRLNVLVTRARREMRVFSSIRDHDINPTQATSDGPRLLRDFLAYAEHRRIAGTITTGAAQTESPFERDVYLELTRRGVRLQPQVGVCGYRVDLGVLDDEVAGRYVCGIECDGVAYHAMETVRDRDRLRQQVLEDRGWIIHRVWSTDWFKDRQGQIERLVTLIAESRDRVRREIEEGATAASEPVPAAAAPQSRESLRAGPNVPQAGYMRPSAARYRMYAGPATPPRGEILEAPIVWLAAMVVEMAEVESPVHEADVIARISDLWRTRAGSRVQATIRSAIADAVRERRIERRGPFYWRSGGELRVRSRADTGIPGDRIAPEEYVEAVKLVLADGRAFQRQTLISETRAVMGYNRTGPVLEEAIGNVIDALVVQGLLGEASAGLTLRGAAV
jgi:very-short-patch-repair endonuclease